jgi:hypothetical protein
LVVRYKIKENRQKRTDERRKIGLSQRLFSFICPLSSPLRQQWFYYFAVYISEPVAPALAFKGQLFVVDPHQV